MSERPKACEDCKAAFAPGEAAYKSPSGDGLALCGKCAEARLPRCEVCGLPATGSIGKMGGKIYHTDCLKCQRCKNAINGKCSQMGKGFMCGDCAAHVHEQAAKAMALQEQGDAEGAAEIARRLVADGVDLPPEMLNAPARPTCCLCSKLVGDQYAKMGDSVVCLPCGKNVTMQMQQAQEAATKGDFEEAVRIAKSLAAKGVDVPPSLLELGPIPKCAYCAGTIKESYVKMGDAMICEGCRDTVKTEVVKLGELAAQGDTAGVARIADKLAAKGIPLPPGMLEGAGAAPNCVACSKTITGKCAKMGDGYICFECGSLLSQGVAKAKECLDSGDSAGAAEIAKALISKGIPLPEQLTRALPKAAARPPASPSAAASSSKPPGGSALAAAGSRIGSGAPGSAAAVEASVPASAPAATPAKSSSLPKASSKASPKPQASPKPRSSLTTSVAAGSGSSAAKALSSAAPSASAKAKGKPAPSASAPSLLSAAGARISASGTSAGASPVATSEVPPPGSPASVSAPLDTGVLDDLLKAPPADQVVSKVDAPSAPAAQPKAKEPEILKIVGGAPAPSFGTAELFLGEERKLFKTAQSCTCRARLNDADWDVVVHWISAGDTQSKKVALCLHGFGTDRCCAFWAKFWCRLHAAGYHILTFDMPGHGQSSAKPLPARGAQDAELVLAVITAFADRRLGQISCFSDAGGSAAFIRAYTMRPDVFSGHHVMTNPVISNIPPTFKASLEAHGTDLFLLFADGWSKSDIPFSIANCAKMFAFWGECADRIQLLTLIPPEPGQIQSPGIKAMRAAEYLSGRSTSMANVSKGPSFYSLVPSEECVTELLGYLESPRKQPVVDGGALSAPVKTALEMGQVNESFRVFVRIRPMLKREQQSASCVQVEDVTDFPRDPPPQRIKVRAPSADDGLFKHHVQQGEFVFDRVFEPGGQVEVFDQVAKPLVETVLQGTNVTMFAYGQTGTGKTYTMEGPASDEGLIHHSVHLLFRGLDATQCVYFQYVQLYNTDFKDLLDPDSTKHLAVEEGAKFMKVRGASVASASSPEELLQRVARGAQYRASGKTNMNDASSRSHAILCIMVATVGCEPDTGTAMYLVDLAGSERVKRSGVQSGTQGFAEATSINTALSALGRVVVSLVERDGKRAAHIPYMDNELTHLLKSSIGGRSKTALICCITSADDSLDESINTLRFALQASHVKNQVADKAKKDQAAAEAEAIEGAAHELRLAADGTGEVPTPLGAIPVRGSWGDAGACAICVHDFGANGSQFDGLISELSGHMRVLAPTFEMVTEKDPAPLVARLLALLDWLGVATPILVGRDFGAIVCAAFKVAHPGRGGPLVAENRHQKMNADQYKARMKKQPDYVMKQYMDCWTLIGGFDTFGMGADKSAKAAFNTKALKGKSVLLWPCHFKGNPDPKMRNQQMAMTVAKALKTQVVDSYSYTDAQVAEHILKLA